MAPDAARPLLQRMPVRPRAAIAGAVVAALLLTAGATSGVASGPPRPFTTQVGVAEADITYHIGAGQGGWGSRWRIEHTESQPIETNMYGRLMRSTEGVHMKQRIKAFVFDNGQRKLALLSTDLLGTVQMFHRAIADEVAEDPGIAWDDLMIVATHSEANPSNATLSPLLSAYAGVFDEDFARTVFVAATTAIREAARDLEPVRFAAGFTEVDAVGNFVFGGSGRPTVDSGLDVMRFDRLDGTTKGVLVAYPGHFNLGGDEAVLTSSDGAGYVERMLEQRIALRQEERPVVGYLPGTVGDSGVNEPDEENFYQETESSAIEIADGAMDVYESLQPGPFIVNAVAERFPPPADHEVPNFPLLAGAPIPFMVSHSLHVQVFQIGDVVLAGVPGEPVTELGYAIRDRIADLGFARGIPLSHANDWTGYIYTTEQYDAQQGRSDQGAYGRNQGWYLVDKAIDLAKVLLNPEYDYGRFDRSMLMLADDFLNALSAWAIVTATPVTHEVRDAILIPNIVLECGGLAEPTDVARFDQTVFGWRGGNNGADMPRVELQRLTGTDPADEASWTTVLDDSGYELHLWMKVYRLQPSDPIVPGEPGCNELLDQQYSVLFEPSFEFPAGTYRFTSTGVFRTLPKTNEAYQAVSGAFTVSAGALDAAVSVAGGDVEVELVYPVDPEGVRFRPRDTVGGTAEVSVNDVPVGTATFDAARGALVLSGVALSPGDEVTVTAAADPWGNVLAAPVSITV
ncbi:MAG TPA: neutral/alkaline non-lysosomal ceramidase N-terminal domain-containing protein [Actinomycetota bacterium]